MGLKPCFFIYGQRGDRHVLIPHIACFPTAVHAHHGGSAVLLVLCIIAYPDKSFQASLQGLKVWWTIIFPALLPFLILSEMLKAYGWVHGIGVLLDPFMRTLFQLPGIGGWAWSVG